MTGAIAMGTNKITGLGDPTNAQDAATKNYIDTAVLAPSNLTGVITSVGNVTSTGAQTGTGSTFVMQDSPTLTTPNIGVATATSVNGTTIQPVRRWYNYKHTVHCRHRQAIQVVSTTDVQYRLGAVDAYQARLEWW